MLLRVADRFGFKVQSLQHVLEGYKVAAEIAAHGASCSLFSDWWAYKIEAFDAIPFTAALLHEAGATVCLKSDSNELVRHLYQEAAKIVKYGGMSEEDALKAITLNPAKQLGLDEPHRAASRSARTRTSPSSTATRSTASPRCEMTLVEGEVYFQRSDKLTPFAPAADGPAKPATRSTFPKFEPDGADPAAERRRSTTPGEAPIDRRRPHRRRARSTRSAATSMRTAATVLNSKTLHVYPGMIDAGTRARPDRDRLGEGDARLRRGRRLPAGPAGRPSRSIPNSELIPVTRANGVLTVVDAADRRRDRRAGGADQPGRLGAEGDGRRRPAGPAHRVPGREPGLPQRPVGGRHGPGGRQEAARGEDSQAEGPVRARPGAYDAGRKANQDTPGRARAWKRCSPTPAARSRSSSRPTARRRSSMPSSSPTS